MTTSAMEVRGEFRLNAAGQYECLVDIGVHAKINQIKGFIGYHQPRKNINDVECVYVRFSTVVIFPSNLQAFFPNLESLELHMCSLKQISRRDLIKSNLQARSRSSQSPTSWNILIWEKIQASTQFTLSKHRLDAAHYLSWPLHSATYAK